MHTMNGHMLKVALVCLCSVAVGGNALQVQYLGGEGWTAVNHNQCKFSFLVVLYTDVVN